MTHYEEKRNFIRMKAGSPARVELGDGSVIQATCQDLSASGMLLATDTRVAMDEELTVSLISHHGHSPSLHASCSIVRCEPGSGNSFLLGLKIEEILNQTEQPETA